MEDKFVGVFSMLDVETVEAADYSAHWELVNEDKLKTRKYYPETFSDKYNRVYYWVGENRKRIDGLTLEEQEEIFIKEGLLTKEDI